ncbi:hypothetical protein BJX63DRAFT_438836, partial [Aspergillus granulosus]
MAWLDLTCDATGWSLVDTGRLDGIVKDLGHPVDQYPSMVSFLGNKNRILALRSLFPHNNVTRRGSAGTVRLHLDSRTTCADYPVLVAEGSLQDGPVATALSKHGDYDGACRYPIGRDDSETAANAKHHLMTKSLLPWMHVSCFFADGIAEWAVVKSLLEESQNSIVAGGCSTPARMRVILVLMSTTAVNEPQPLQMNISVPDLQTISILDLRDRHQLSGPALFAPLRRLLLDELEHSRTELMQRGLLFSAVHLAFLWRRSLRETFGPTALRIDCLYFARERLP